ncbi:hypothetical protein GCM10023145_35480 [Angustibacter luteus]
MCPSDARGGRDDRAAVIHRLGLTYAALVAVLIDPPAWPAHGRLWSHLVSDVSYEELHAFAAAAGVPRRAFEGDHYDVPQERYHALVAAGARAVAGRDLLLGLQRSGLRVPKRKGERVLRTWPDGHLLPDVGPHRVDVIASRLGPPADTTVGVALLARAGGRFALADDALPALPDPQRGQPLGHLRARFGPEPASRKLHVALRGVSPAELIAALAEQQPLRWAAAEELADLPALTYWLPLLDRLRGPR